MQPVAIRSLRAVQAQNQMTQCSRRPPTTAQDIMCEHSAQYQLPIG